MTDHWFWLLITITCVVWYSTITIYVSVKGVSDIRNMLKRLAAHGPKDDQHIRDVEIHP